MSTHDDFDINITQTEDSELSEKEYSDILGLEGMAGGGETALEEETEEDPLPPAPTWICGCTASSTTPSKRSRTL